MQNVQDRAYCERRARQERERERCAEGVAAAAHRQMAEEYERRVGRISG